MCWRVSVRIHIYKVTFICFRHKFKHSTPHRSEEMRRGAESRGCLLLRTKPCSSSRRRGDPGLKIKSSLSKKDQKQFHLFWSHLCYKSNLQFEAKLIKGWFHLFWSHLFCLSLHHLQSGPLFPHLQTRRQIRHRDIFENQIRGDCSIHSTNILMFIVMPPKG